MKKIRFWKAYLPVCCISLFMVGCNSSGDMSTTPPATDTVTISGMQFHSAELLVNKGDTVIWINLGIVGHDVTSFPGKEWTSDTIAIDQSWKKVIDKNIDYFCSIHPTMKGKVMVKQ